MIVPDAQSTFSAEVAVVIAEKNLDVYAEFIMDLNDGELAEHESYYGASPEVVRKKLGNAEEKNSSVIGIVKFDTCCSHSMSGDSNRIQDGTRVMGKKVMIRGFNNSTSTSDAVGMNKDAVRELYVSSMPTDLTLLCAHEYIEKDGAAVLFAQSGQVLKISESEQDELRNFVSKFETTKFLKVTNRTYEVDATENENCTEELVHTATTYFNTKVNVSNGEERILAYLLGGFSIYDMLEYKKYNCVTGFSPDLTTKALNSFENQWGRTPDVIQLAHPDKMGNKKGYGSVPTVYTHCGQVVEMDYGEPDFNEVADESTLTDNQKNSIRKKPARKLRSHGGADAFAVAVDAYSGFIWGQLVSNQSNSLELVQNVFSVYERAGHKIETFASDSGVNSQASFRVKTPAVEKYVEQVQKANSHRAEPYNHSNGGAHVEVAIKTIKRLMRMAIQYILRNPNFHHLKFTKDSVMRLWGEVFNWAIVVINFKMCTNVKGKTKYEVYTGQVPNIQDVRMLPIFSVLMALRYTATSSENIDQSNNCFFQYGLYVGPDLKVTGGIRVAVVTGNSVRMIVTSKYKAVSDGGCINIYPQVQRGLRSLLEGDGANIEAVNENSAVSDVNESTISESESVISDLSPVSLAPLNLYQTNEKSRGDVQLVEVRNPKKFRRAEKQN